MNLILAAAGLLSGAAQLRALATATGLATTSTDRRRCGRGHRINYRG
jgi:hypothetical protein